MEGLLKRVNDGVYAVERGIVVITSVLMAIVVFFDVVHRRYSSAESKLVEKLGKWTGMDPEGSLYGSLQDASSFIVWVLAFGLVYFGIRSASRRPLFEEVPKAENEEPIAVGRAAAMSAAILAACWIILRIFFGNGEPQTILECPETYTWDCGIWPHGVTWAQPLALVFTLWLGFLGASMATRDHRHLKVEALQRFLPEQGQKIAGLLSALVASAFCVFMAYLAYRYVGYMHQDYVDSDGLGALHDGIDLPRYQTFMIVPAAYMLMATRFIATGVLAWRGELDTTPTELADLDMNLGSDAEGPENEAEAVVDPHTLDTADDGPKFDPDGYEAEEGEKEGSDA